ncbi:MAG: YdjY domain-containing protein [Phycisphaerae bacterium]|nr:YdjY domain-containing protein [Phycisphaerae bacterium]
MKPEKMGKNVYPLAAAAAATLMLAAIAATSAAGEPPPGPPPEHLAPIILEADDAGGPKPAPVAEAKPAEEIPPIRVDEEARSVRIPVRFSRAEGTAEWLLSTGQKHRQMSVLVTDQPAKAVAAALVKAGLPSGKPPAPLANDRVRPPTGTTVELELVVARSDGTETRYPANLFLATSPGGDPVENGRWVYVGPPVAREGEAEILVTTLSGSLVTTNLRDSSALVYWAPNEAEGYVRSFYLSGVPLPPEGFACELEIRASEPKPPVPIAEESAGAPEGSGAPEAVGEAGAAPGAESPAENP